MNMQPIQPLPTRRSILARAGTLCGGLAATGSARAADATATVSTPGSGPSPGTLRPLAQDYTLIARVPSVDTHWIHDPGLVSFDDGELFVSSPCRARHKDGEWFTQIHHSVDGGASWRALPNIPFTDATPIIYEGRLYMLGQVDNHGDWLAMASDDRGRTWSEPVTLFEGRFWNTITAMVIRGGKLYWALTQGGPGESDLIVVSCDLKAGLLNPVAWRRSNAVVPPFPTHCAPDPAGDVFPTRFRKMWCLEPNVVEINGRIRVIARTVIRGYVTASLATILDVRDDADGLSLSFSQYHPVPGAQCKMFILRDPTTGLHWMLSNLPADSQDQWDTYKQSPKNRDKGGPGNDRRTLFLHYSLDGLNWWPAACVAQAPRLRQSFMYASAVIEGDDLLFISRTSVDGLNQHDADLCTFHRVRGFRRFALQMQPLPT